MKKTKPSNPRSMYGITGVAGEYFVAAELSRRDWIATVTLKNTPNIDVLATRRDGSRTINVQVKTRSPTNKQGWVLDSSIEKPVAKKNFFVVLVQLKGRDELPDYYVIPRNALAGAIRRRHVVWLETPGREGQKHNDNTIRNFKPRQHPRFAKYLNNWDVLELS